MQVRQSEAPPKARELMARFRISALDATRIRLWWLGEEHQRARALAGIRMLKGGGFLSVPSRPSLGVPGEVRDFLRGEAIAPNEAGMPGLFAGCVVERPACLLLLLVREYVESSLSR